MLKVTSVQTQILNSFLLFVIQKYVLRVSEEGEFNVNNQNKILTITALHHAFCAFSQNA